MRSDQLSLKGRESDVCSVSFYFVTHPVSYNMTLILLQYFDLYYFLYYLSRKIHCIS